jgi:hypothetical protein
MLGESMPVKNGSHQVGRVTLHYHVVIFTMLNKETLFFVFVPPASRHDKSVHNVIVSVRAENTQSEEKTEKNERFVACSALLFSPFGPVQFNVQENIGGAASCETIAQDMRQWWHDGVFKVSLKTHIDRYTYELQ